MRDAATIKGVLKTALEQVPGVVVDGDMYDEADPEDGTTIRDGFWFEVDGRQYQLSIAETSDSLSKRNGN